MQYKMEEYVVAFIDVLGSSKRIKNDSENSLNIVHAVYDNVINSRDELYDNENIKKLKPIVKIYSDNIVIAVPTKEKNGYSAFISIAILSCLIQQEFLKYKYLVRGGISMGSFFVDDTMLWGDALLDAYYIESDVAIYPRIVIHPKTIAKLDLALNPERQKWIKQDADGLFFVDYMQETVFKTNYLEILLYRIDECEEMLLEILGDTKLEQKIHWHTTYLLSKIDIYSPEYTEALKYKLKD